MLLLIILFWVTVRIPVPREQRFCSEENIDSGGMNADSLDANTPTNFLSSDAIGFHCNVMSVRCSLCCAPPHS